MKKYFFILTCLLLILSCDSHIKKDVTITSVTIKVKINENLDQSSLVYHLYFENADLKKNSFGINLINIDDYVNIELFRGNYNIYCYGLIEKSTITKKVYSLKIMKQVKITSGNEINIDLTKLYPDFEITNIDGNYSIKIFMNKITDVFSVSSLSVKQGTDKVRTVNFYNDKINHFYYADITFYQNGEWLMNISFSLKTKIDENVLENDGINISTSNFTDIIIGNY